MLRIAAMDIRGRDGLPKYYELVHPDDVKDADPDEIIDRITSGINSM